MRLVAVGLASEAPPGKAIVEIHGK
jgi:hypothetical protein